MSHQSALGRTILLTLGILQVGEPSKLQLILAADCLVLYLLLGWEVDDVISLKHLPRYCLWSAAECVRTLGFDQSHCSVVTSSCTVCVPLAWFPVALSVHWWVFCGHPSSSTVAGLQFTSTLQMWLV